MGNGGKEKIGTADRVASGKEFHRALKKYITPLCETLGKNMIPILLQERSGPAMSLGLAVARENASPGIFSESLRHAHRSVEEFRKTVQETIHAHHTRDPRKGATSS